MRVTWSPAARSDLDRTGTWLDDNRGLSFSADMLELIYRRSRFLEDFPHGGRPLIGLIVYRLHLEAADVVRVHHEREDWLVEP